mmetsp:Transcript_26860/g.45783  ORF Transcript_26860/g.45783 Transcript_26860/m.45783 type:complete len:327 (+) Transcript_26860:216-1196(+)
MNNNNGGEDAEFQKWFPGLYRPRTGTKCNKAKLRILCFPPAGCAEDLFSTEGTGTRHEKSPLLEWAHSQSTEVLAVQYPGRNNRKRLGESPVKSIAEIVTPLHSVLCDYWEKYDNDENDMDVPYVIIAHSVGTWIAYELLQLIQSNSTKTSSKKMQMPEHVFFSSFPPPTIPHDERPWRINAQLNEEQFKEECRRWNVNEIVFTHVWSVYHPLLRADFTLFDQYTHQHATSTTDDAEKKKFNFPMTIFHAKHDGMITQSMCESWKEFIASSSSSSTDFESIEIENGHHLFPLEKEQKSLWLKLIVKRLEDVMDMIELKLEYAGMGL